MTFLTKEVRRYCVSCIGHFDDDSFAKELLFLAESTSGIQSPHV